MTALLKEDGSLDVEFINNLPHDEYINVIGNLTEQQFEEYVSKNVINEDCESFPIHTINTSIEEYVRRNGLVPLNETINNLHKKYGFK